MAVKVNDVFKLAMSLCDGFNDGNEITEDEYTNYCAQKAVSLCHICQNEILSFKPLMQTIEIDCSQEPVDTIGNTKIYTFNKPVEYVTEYHTDNSLSQADINIKGNRIYVPESYKGRIVFVCSVLASPLVSMQSVFSAEDTVVLELLPLYLAANFLLEENPSRSEWYLSTYINARNRLKKEQTSIEETEDIYR